MDWGHFKKILLLRCHHSYGENMCVHSDIWNKKIISKISNDLAHFSNFQPNPNLKNEPK